MQDKYNFVVTGVAGKIGKFLSQDKRLRRFAGFYNNTKPVKYKKGEYFKVDLSKELSLPEEKMSKYDFVIHTAAKTHIDECERDKRNSKSGEVWRSNVDATENIVNYCKKYKKKLVFLSTECVFNGKKSFYKEDDETNPKSWYGKTKLEAEKVVINSNIEYIIIRSVMAYNLDKRPNDIVQLMYNKLNDDGQIEAVGDQRTNPTYTKDIVNSIFHLISSNVNGIYHVAGSSVVSPYQIALKLTKYIPGKKSSVKSVPLNEYFTPDKAILRLKNAVLDSAKYTRETGVKTKSIDEGLKLIYGKNLV